MDNLVCNSIFIYMKTHNMNIKGHICSLLSLETALDHLYQQQMDICLFQIILRTLPGVYLSMKISMKSENLF